MESEKSKVTCVQAENLRVAILFSSIVKMNSFITDTVQIEAKTVDFESDWLQAGCLEFDSQQDFSLCHLVWNPHIPSSNVYDGLFP
jgi:hypothetical protein